MLIRALASRSVRAADAANRAREWDRAARGYERALRLRPDLGDIHIQHGHAIKQQGRLHAAARACRAAATRPDDAAEPWLHLGHVLMRLELWSESEAAFAAALTRDPACDEAARARDVLRARARPDPEPTTAEYAVLQAHDLAPAVLRRLDSDFYRALWPGLESCGVPALLEHFGRTGLEALAPLNPTDRFDPVFYRAGNSPLRRVSDAAAYRHWLNLGAADGRAPDRASWARQALGSLPSRVDPVVRAFAEAAVAAEAAAPSAEPPLAAMLRRLDAADVPAHHRASVLAGAACCLEAAGRRADAEALMQRHDLRDVAAILDRMDGRPPALSIEAAGRLERAGDGQGALALLARAREENPHSADLRAAVEAAADWAIRFAWEAALAAATADPAALAPARDRLAAVVEQVAGVLGHGEPPAERPAARPRIALVTVFAPPQVCGGATRVVADNLLDFRDRFDLAVFATEEGSGPAGWLRTAPWCGVPVTTVSHPGGGDDMRTWHDVMGDRFAAWLDTVRPALVHFHCIQRLTAAVVEICRHRGIPYIVTAYDGWWVSPWQFCLDRDGLVALYDYSDPVRTLRDLGPDAFERCLRLAPSLRGAAAVLAVSPALADLYRRAGVGRVRAVSNGVSRPLEVMRQHRAEGPYTSASWVACMPTRAGRCSKPQSRRRLPGRSR